MHWLDALSQCRARGVDAVIVTILGVRGSVPREPGAKMIVDAQHSYDSIGGGRLEYDAIAQARDFLASGGTIEEQIVKLGPDTGQCCGGEVRLQWEVVRHRAVAIFGAGHVGQALVGILQALPVHVLWADDRSEYFTHHAGNIEHLSIDEALRRCEALSPESSALVMTHDHQLDLRVCDTLLRQSLVQDVAMIGSRSKAAKFKRRLDPTQWPRFRSPIATPGPSKLPMAVAVNIAHDWIARHLIHTPEKDRSPTESHTSIKDCEGCSRCVSIVPL